MFKLMFWDKAGNHIEMKDKESLYFDLYELAYCTAHMLLPIMIEKGAVSMTISNTSQCYYNEYPIINGKSFRHY